MRKVLVIGCGVSGIAVIEDCLSKNVSVTAVDKVVNKTTLCNVFCEDHIFDPFDFDLVVVSPGVKLDHPQVKCATEHGIEVIGEVELALRRSTNFTIGITGTNGKSTVVSLITHVLNSVGKKAFAVGNIGMPIISLVDKINVEDILVVELSSFQLMTMKKRSLDVAVILNITPDHIDWHGSMEEYVKAKLRIKHLLKEGGLFLYPVENIEACLLVCRRLGISDVDFEKGVSSFQALEHRLEYVTTIDGIRCVNDSKATNIDSLRHALSSIEGSIVLICGGINKGISMSPLSEIIEKRCRAVILLGESKNLIAKELSEKTKKVLVNSMEEATEKGLQHAIRGDTLLLAPGCSSFDMFENYMARGKEFKRTLKNLNVTAQVN